MKFDFLIVGAGFSGCVLAERIATQLNKKVLIVEKRNHIGGNAFDFYNEAGILIHKYGPHWFHTSSSKIFKYLSQFTEWRLHSHRVRSYVDGILLPIPINMDTINFLYNKNFSHPSEVEKYLKSVRKKIAHPKNAEEMVLSSVGNDLYEKFFKGYTIKQWGISPSKLSASVTARIPTRYNRDDRYFNDIYQAMPKYGYSYLFHNLIKHPNISVLLKTDYKNIIDDLNFNQMIYTGPIDEFFDYLHGKLPYRSLQFEHETLDSEFYQEYQQVNYPNDYDFTRIVEWKHATGQKHPRTTITKEYPCDPSANGNEKYYPVPNDENRELYRKYHTAAKKLKAVYFCGRLADYQYYNMDQVVARALSIFEKSISKK